MAHVGTMARAYRFGRFLLEPDRRCLSADGALVPLGSRAFDILQMLIEQRDTVVSRDDILAHVWRGTVVEGNTLAVQISALRRALGEPQMIVTVAGRGYRFVGMVEPVADDCMPPSPLATTATLHAPTSELRRRSAVLVSLLMALLGVGLLVGRDRVWPRHVAPRLSIVVLPFRNLGRDSDEDYLADAISDDLTTDLSHIPGSVVIARTSADSYKGRAVPTGEIGRALDVRYVLEGSLMAEGGHLHINAQLIDAPSGAHLWARAFDVPRDKLGEARSDIVQLIGSALNVTLVDVEGARSLRERPNKPDAVDLYLRARSVLDRGMSLASTTQAQRILESAVAIDPDFAEGVSALAIVLLHKIIDYDDPDELRDHDEATRMLSQASRFAPQSITAMFAKGLLEAVDRKVEEARATFRLVLSMDPNDVRAIGGLARCARDTGQMAEMIEDVKLLQRIDPAGPASAVRQYWIGLGYLLEGDAKSALAWLRLAGAGAATADGDTRLTWQEWRQLSFIAANEIAGFKHYAASLYQSYRVSHPRRTAWLLLSYATHAIAVLPGQKKFEEALIEAGMPDHALEDEDFHIEAVSQPQSGSDFSPTPRSILHGQVISTSELRDLVKPPGAAPAIIDVGRAAATIHGAVWISAQGWWVDFDQALSNTDIPRHKNQPVIVMGNGPYGWKSYNRALHMIADGYTKVVWYRGGEDAWSAAGLQSEDRRAP